MSEPSIVDRDCDAYRQYANMTRAELVKEREVTFKAYLQKWIHKIECDGRIAMIGDRIARYDHIGPGAWS